MNERVVENNKFFIFSNFYLAFVIVCVPLSNKLVLDSYEKEDKLDVSVSSLPTQQRQLR